MRTVKAQTSLRIRPLYSSMHSSAYIAYVSGKEDTDYPVSILYKSIAGRYRPVRVADGPITARYRFRKNATLVDSFKA